MPELSIERPRCSVCGGEVLSLEPAHDGRMAVRCTECETAWWAVARAEGDGESVRFWIELEPRDG